MDLKSLQQRLLKVAQTLESRNADISAARIRKLAEDLGKMVPQYPPSQQETQDAIARTVNGIKQRLPGTKVEWEVNSSSAHDMIYYRLELRNGTKLRISQDMNPHSTMKPFMVYLTQGMRDIPSGTQKSEKDLVSFLVAVAQGSPKEMAQLQKEMVYKAATIALEKIANNLENRGLVKEANLIDKISNALEAEEI